MLLCFSLIGSCGASKRRMKQVDVQLALPSSAPTCMMQMLTLSPHTPPPHSSVFVCILCQATVFLRIPRQMLQHLQQSILRSHSCGFGCYHACSLLQSLSLAILLCLQQCPHTTREKVIIEARKQTKKTLSGFTESLRPLESRPETHRVTA